MKAKSELTTSVKKTSNIEINHLSKTSINKHINQSKVYDKNITNSIGDNHSIDSFSDISTIQSEDYSTISNKIIKSIIKTTKLPISENLSIPPPPSILTSSDVQFEENVLINKINIDNDEYLEINTIGNKKDCVNQFNEDNSKISIDVNNFSNKFDNLRNAVKPVTSQELHDSLAMLKYDIHREIQDIIREQARQFSMAKSDTLSLIEKLNQQLVDVLQSNKELRAENEKLRKIY